MLNDELKLTKKSAPSIDVVTFAMVKTHRKSCLIPRLMVTVFSPKVSLLVPLAVWSF